ncbi:MAG: aldo/keto reductase [Bacteroidetes bacterium]|nr:MAG: aldo/keto reductase [Bacteroidota bacterium]
MQYRPLGPSGLSVSEISFGCMSLGEDHAQNARLLHEAYDLGINLFDTADLYQRGFNEESVGRAFAGRRDQVLIATKVGNQWRPDGTGWDWNPRKAYILRAVEDSLRRLRTDYIDLYQLHGGTLDDPIDETIEAFEQLKAAGKIRHYGISSIRPNVVQTWLRRAGLVSVMSQYSLLDRRPEEQIMPMLAEAGIGLLVRGGVAKGLLAGKPAAGYLEHEAPAVARVQGALATLGGDPAAWALRYALDAPAVATVVAGIRTGAQLRANVAASQLPPLTPVQRQQLDDVIPPLVYTQHRV